MGGTKTPKVELTVSVDGVAIQEPKSKKIQHQYPLHRISYCADDKAEKRFFSFIAKEADSDKHTCFVFVSDKLAEEITLTIGQAFDLAYKRFLSGKSVESETEKIARLERENAELRQRLRDVGSLLGKTKLAELDTMTLDDLNDDDFDPRAGTGDTGDSSDTSDDFNPRGTGVTTSNPRTQSMGTPIIKPPSAVTTSQATPARILPPPSLPPRDPSKITAAKVPGVTNPFSSPASDPFGTSNFSSAKPSDPFTSSVPSFGTTDFSLDELDPLKK